MNPPKIIRLVNAGPMGEPEVLRNLLGPQIKVTEITLPGLQVYRQAQPPEHVWSAMKEFWDDAGKPYGGAFTLVPQEEASAVVGCIEFDSPAALKPVAQRLSFWSFHDGRNPQNAWFQYREIRREGDISYITERLNADPSTLVPVEEGYRETSEYKAYVAEMARQAEEYRLEQEGSFPRKEAL